MSDLALCICGCGETLSERQRYRHLRALQSQLELELSYINQGATQQEAGQTGGNFDEGGDANDAEVGGDDPGGNEFPELPQDIADGDIPMDEPSVDVFPDLTEVLPPAFGLRRNPPVTVEDWPDPDPDLDSIHSEDEDLDHYLPDDLEYDPEYFEREEPLGLNPEDEPHYTDERLREMLNEVLGDAADEEWIDMYMRNLKREDYIMLQFLATRLRTHFSRQTYDDLRHGACEELRIPSEYVAWRRLRILSALETRSYDCCINSCCCFLGKYRDLERCSFCNENRYNANGEPRRVFRYSPLIPQLQALFQNPQTAYNVRHRSRVERLFDPDVIQDVFDSINYRTLRLTQLSPDSEYRIFDHPNDLALGLSTDGVTLFKRRRRGHSTAWPIILINYNLHPKIRTRLENVLCVGVIPGPRQCKDLNSFLIPLLDELLELENGVPSSAVKPRGRPEDANNEDADGAEVCEGVAVVAGEGNGAGEGNDEAAGYYFVLRAFVIIVFGDIPAISKLICMKGHNAITPCRACYIQGVLCRLRKNSVYYVPLWHPEEPIPTQQLYMRTHELFIQHLAELDAARQRTQVEFDNLAKEYGINGRSVFTHLRSINLATSFPYDIMHLLFENLVPNMIRHWTGTFKGLDQGNGTYQISKQFWDAVGQLTKGATKTTPSSFVGTLPDIAQDFNLYKAEALAFWIQYLAPILLKDVLPNRYYRHLLLLREIVLLCLQFEITHTEIDKLQEMIHNWVADYEKYYYQYRSSRLPTCPLTIHALLHIPYYIRHTGPLWASWAFVMERFCGHLLPAVKNRVRPYDHLDNYIQRRAQMQIVSKIYDLPSIAKPFVHFTYEHGEKVSSREHVYPEFPDFILGTPVNKNVVLNVPLVNQLARYFGIFRPGLRGDRLRDRITRGDIVRYGRIRMAGDGDRIRTATLITRDPMARDNSYIKYDLLPDANAAWRNRRDDPYRETQYGRLLDVFYIRLLEDDYVTLTPYLLLRVEPCNTRGLDATKPETPVVTYTERDVQTPEIINAKTLIAVVGRVRMGRSWAIIDRSRSNARTQFVDEEGNVEFDD